MKLACTTFPFQSLPLGAALRHIRELGFEWVDLPIYSAREWGYLTPEEVRNEPAMALGLIETATLTSGVGIAAITLSTNAESNQERGDFEAVCNMAARLGVGIINVFAYLKDEWLARNRLKDFLAIVRERKLTLCVENSPTTIAIDPETAYRLVAETPGLMISLNPANLTAYGYSAVTWTQLFPYVRNCFVRDGGHTPDMRQMPWGTGEVDWAFVLNGLRKSNYDGPLTIAYIGTRPDDSLRFDPEPEILKARVVMEKFIAG